MKFHVYIIRGIDNYFYCGLTGKLEQRMQQHNSKKNKSTKRHTPLTLMFLYETDSRTKARFVEKMIKAQGVQRWYYKQHFTYQLYRSNELIEQYYHTVQMQGR